MPLAIVIYSPKISISSIGNSLISKLRPSIVETMKFFIFSIDSSGVVPICSTSFSTPKFAKESQKAILLKSVFSPNASSSRFSSDKFSVNVDKIAAWK